MQDKRNLEQLDSVILFAMCSKLLAERRITVATADRASALKEEFAILLATDASQPLVIRNWDQLHKKLDQLKAQLAEFLAPLT
jgi:hypothetical protein